MSYGGFDMEKYLVVHRLQQLKEYWDVYFKRRNHG